jgi:hypothetical protein
VYAKTPHDAERHGANKHRVGIARRHGDRLAPMILNTVAERFRHPERVCHPERVVILSAAKDPQPAR